LRNYLESERASIYQDALGFVKIKTQNSDYPFLAIPTFCIYSIEQSLDLEWYPINLITSTKKSKKVQKKDSSL